eukprot:SAG11_NODE_29390_length_311_cov_0.966981_1_plen_90_part_01
MINSHQAHIGIVYVAQSDFVGIDGNHQDKAAYPKSVFAVLSDKIQTLTPITESSTGAGPGNIKRQFQPLLRIFNFTCNRQLRLSAMNTDS